MGGMDPGGCIWGDGENNSERGHQEAGKKYLCQNASGKTQAPRDNHSGETCGKTLKRILKGFALARDWLSIGSGANRVFGSDSSGDVLGDWDGLPSHSAQLRPESTNMFCILRYNKFLRPHSPSFFQYGDVW